MRAARLASLALPFAFIICGQAETADQAVAAAVGDQGAIGIGESAEIDRGIDELRLRRQRPIARERDLLSGFYSEAIAEAAFSLAERAAQRRGGKVAVE